MRITFVGPLISTFVKNDLTILSRANQVKAFDVQIGKGYQAIGKMIALHFHILVSLLTSDCLFFWFADYYTLIPSLVARALGKKVFVVAGGFDITYIPELGIGARTRPLRWFAVKNTFKIASHIFPVSMDTQHDLDEAVPNHPPSTMIYNAVDTSVYKYKEAPRQQMALTVSQADSIREYRRKGIDTFIESSVLLPEVEFHVVGVRGEVVEEARNAASEFKNVTIRPGRLPLEEILNEFWDAAAYCQFSIEERFGVSVAEAMSCGCIPVVTPVKAVLEVVGDSGVIVDKNSKDSIAGGITRALAASNEERRQCAEHASQFDIEHRAIKLLGVVHR